MKEAHNMSTTAGLPPEERPTHIAPYRELSMPESPALTRLPELVRPARRKLLQNFVVEHPFVSAVIGTLFALALFRGFQIHISDITIHFGR
jgi:hypothetical protein